MPYYPSFYYSAYPYSKYYSPYSSYYDYQYYSRYSSAYYPYSRYYPSYLPETKSVSYETVKRETVYSPYTGARTYTSVL